MKNINSKNLNLEWAYKSNKVEVDSEFKLTWKNNWQDAKRPKEKDLILLRQRSRKTRQSYITHIVKVCDRELHQKEAEGDYTIYREVKVLWNINWNNLTELSRTKDVLRSRFLSQNGNVIWLENTRFFREHWQNQGGLIALHDYIRTTLKLSDN